MRRAIWLPGCWRLLLLWAAQLQGVILQGNETQESHRHHGALQDPLVFTINSQASRPVAERRSPHLVGNWQRRVWLGAAQGGQLLAAAIARSRRCSRQPDHQASTGGPGDRLRGKGRRGGCGLGLGERWGGFKVA